MAEQWDVYDVNRQRTGRIIERPSAWGQEAYHLIIHVAIFDANHRMLIQRRSPRKHAWADLWDISSGGNMRGQISGISVPAAVPWQEKKAGKQRNGKPLKN